MEDFERGHTVGLREVGLSYRHNPQHTSCAGITVGGRGQREAGTGNKKDLGDLQADRQLHGLHVSKLKQW